LLEKYIPPKKIIKTLLKKNILAGIDLSLFDRKWKNQLLICVTEKRTKEEIDYLVEELKKITQ
jgi:glycine dehydrogenase subunit 1